MSGDAPDGARPPALRDVLRGLEGEYVQSFDAKIECLRSLLHRLEARPQDDACFDRLRMLLHRIRGSAGSYGLAAMSELAGAWEDALDAIPGDHAQRTSEQFGSMGGELDGMRRELARVREALADRRPGPS